MLRKVHASDDSEDLRKESLIQEFANQLVGSPPSPSPLPTCLSATTNSFLLQDMSSSIEEISDKASFTNTHADIMFGSEADLVSLLHELQADEAGRVSIV